eukprot:1161677-Pelagomonas_calceolata.AAC.20
MRMLLVGHTMRMLLVGTLMMALACQHTFPASHACRCAHSAFSAVSCCDKALKEECEEVWSLFQRNREYQNTAAEC